MITIELPEEIVPAATTPEDFARELRLAAPIHWSSRGMISQGKGAQIAGMDRRVSSSPSAVPALMPSRSSQELKTEVESEREAHRQRLADHLPRSRGPA